MSFTPGNQLWQRRSKHPLSYLFKTPGALWEAACEYFNWCIENPVPHCVRGNGNSTVEVPKLRAFTLDGLCTWLDCNCHYFNQFEERLQNHTNAEAEDFRRIITRIRNIIYEQKFTGAAANVLNARIISYELGLVNKAANATGTGEEKKEATIIVWGDHEIPV